MKKQGLAPIIDENTEVLILGSLPGDKSLEMQKYYSSGNNDFWKIISVVIDKDITSFSYSEKIKALLDAHIGLWDVYHSAFRPGSMDKDIAEIELNDFTHLKCPKLRLICFNGQEAGASSHLLKGICKTLVLPSSSGANRRDQEGRLKQWKMIK